MSEEKLFIVMDDGVEGLADSQAMERWVGGGDRWFCLLQRTIGRDCGVYVLAHCDKLCCYGPVAGPCDLKCEKCEMVASDGSVIFWDSTDL